MKTVNMTKQDVIRIGNEMFPEATNGRWGSAFAEVAGISSATVSNILNGAKISNKVSVKIVSAYEDFKVGSKLSTSTGIFSKEEREVAERIGKRFSVAENLTHAMINGKIRSMIISGAAGVGKSYTIEQILSESSAKVDCIKGSVSASGLYASLYKHREEGILIIDDADGIFGDEDGMNLLKGALDSSDKRVLSWKKQSGFVYDEDLLDEEAVKKASEAGKIPNTFEFNGAVIFITNIDFAKEADKGSKMSPHFSALMSRSRYIDLTMNTNFDRIVRMKQIFIEGGMYKKEGISYEQAIDIMGFVSENQDRFRDLSLRLMKHVCEDFHVGSDWKDVVEVTKMK